MCCVSARLLSLLFFIVVAFLPFLSRIALSFSSLWWLLLPFFWAPTFLLFFWSICFPSLLFRGGHFHAFSLAATFALPSYSHVSVRLLSSVLSRWLLSFSCPRALSFFWGAAAFPIVSGAAAFIFFVWVATLLGLLISDLKDLLSPQPFLEFLDWPIPHDPTPRSPKAPQLTDYQTASPPEIPDLLSLPISQLTKLPN